MNTAKPKSFWLTLCLVLSLAVSPAVPALTMALAAGNSQIGHAHQIDLDATGEVVATDAEKAACVDHGTCASSCCAHCLSAIFHVGPGDVSPVKSVQLATVPPLPYNALVSGPIRPPQI